MPVTRKLPPAKTKRKQNETTELLETYSPLKVGKIPRTNTKPKENIFDSFRPKWGSCLDYSISETMVKMDAGDAKINVRDIKATYVPRPPDVALPHSKNIIYSHSGPPVWKFLDEIYSEKQAALQKMHKKNLKEFIVQRKKREMLRGQYMHSKIQVTVGPEWFQELSPKQLKTVDDLRCCMAKDYKNNTFIHTQENIAKLGLVLRPNHRHIKMALKYCGKCPVEFLLILYQLINPNRHCYSINDRLLLSAVVHLTMAETLREMHIRIPSPPYEKKIAIGRRRKTNKKKYDSPYLEPLTFQPDPPKHSGIFANKRLQYPESPYFSYLGDFLMEQTLVDIPIDTTSLTPDEAELIEDMVQAQMAYNQLSNTEHSTGLRLLRPTVKTTPSDVDKFYRRKSKTETVSAEELKLPPLATLDDGKCNCSLRSEESDLFCCEQEMKEKCECCGKCMCREKSKQILARKCMACLEREKRALNQPIITGMATTGSNRVLPIIGGTRVPKQCDCMKDYQNKLIALAARNKLMCRKTVYGIGGVVMSKNGPVYVLTAAIGKVGDDLETEEAFDEYPEQLVSRSTKNTCTCSSQKPTSGGDSESAMCGSSKAAGDCVCGKPKTGYEHEMQQMCECCGICTCREKSKQMLAPKCPGCLAQEKRGLNKSIMMGMAKIGCNRLVPIIGGTHPQKQCDCMENYKNRLIALEARNKLMGLKATYGIGGVVMKKTGPVYILTAAVGKVGDYPNTAKDFCTSFSQKLTKGGDSVCCLESEDEGMPERKRLFDTSCTCREELQIFLSHKCNCEECLVQARQLYVTYIMSGVKTTDSGKVINIMGGVQECRCDCLQKYVAKVQKLEEYKKRIEARYHLKSQNHKYLIGGVVSSPEGPVYVISGLRPPVECKCGQVLREREAEELRLNLMAKMPPTGRVKYGITGVQESPEGNVFILNQTLPIDDCPCLQLYQTFKCAHQPCLDYYDQFLKQIQEAINDFNVEDVNVSEVETQLDLDIFDKMDNIEVEDVKSQEEPLIDTEEIDNEKSEKYTESSPTKENNCMCSSSNTTIKDEKECFRTSIEGADSYDSSQVNAKNDKEDEETSSEDDERCTCGQEELDSTCDCVNYFNSNTKGSVSSQRGMPVNLSFKRFFILSEIPSKYREQKIILKKTLASMAADGFPLAKLPDCYKLPHFKLWMDLRCGKFWTQADRRRYDHYSNFGWAHTDLCYKETPMPKLGIPLDKAREMTWKNAKFCRRIVGDKVNMFYRLVRQEAIQVAREFFPLTFSYEFPTKTFRDCYFAYMPSKEEEVLAFRIVKTYEARQNLKSVKPKNN